MSDPALALQGAIVARLKGADLRAGVFDDVPPNDPFPRVTVGDGQTIANKADCYDGSEVFLQIDAWSRAVGYPEVKRIASKIRAALDDADMDLDGHTLELMEFREAVYSREPDGKTSRARITIRALTQPSD